MKKKRRRYKKKRVYATCISGLGTAASGYGIKIHIIEESHPSRQGHRISLSTLKTRVAW